MILACHTLVYSDDADATRAFFRDVLGFANVDAGTGDDNWLIFRTGPSELGVHPTSGEGFSAPRHHAISFIVDDLDSIGAGLDASYRGWADAPEEARPDHAVIVERYALVLGDYVNRHTDLDWQVVTDVFGTDLALTEGFRGSFVVVPHNLVAARWMRGETGWVPNVVGHIVRLRSRY